MLFRRAYKHEKRGISNQRLAAAKRALQRQLDKLPLFADQIREVQPTPEERIAMADRVNDYISQGMRNTNAKMWRKGRAMLFTLSADDRKQIRAEWNDKVKRGRPASSEYFADMVMHWIRVRYPDYDFGGDIGTAREWTELMERHSRNRWANRIESNSSQLKLF